MTSDPNGYNEYSQNAHRKEGCEGAVKRGEEFPSLYGW